MTKFIVPATTVQIVVMERNMPTRVVGTLTGMYKDKDVLEWINEKVEGETCHKADREGITDPKYFNLLAYKDFIDAAFRPVRNVDNSFVITVIFDGFTASRIADTVYGKGQ